MHTGADHMHDDVRHKAALSSPFRRARRLIGAATLLALWGIGAGACKSSDGPEEVPEVPGVPEVPAVPVPPPSAGPYDTCTVDADCGFGEIRSELVRAEDCPCTYGCPFLPLGKPTIERRQSQYEALCDPRQNGSGEDCGIDDCAPAPTPACVAGKCTAAADD
jgi:hypothetical protein